jgi:hypothetical protein
MVFITLHDKIQRLFTNAKLGLTSLAVTRKEYGLWADEATMEILSEYFKHTWARSRPAAGMAGESRSMIKPSSI